MSYLDLTNFNERKITASEDVKTEMKKLVIEMSNILQLPYFRSSCFVSVLNVRSYLQYEADILNYPLFNLSDVVILTETCLTKQS